MVNSEVPGDVLGNNSIQCYISSPSVIFEAIENILHLYAIDHLVGFKGILSVGWICLRNKKRSIEIVYILGSKPHPHRILHWI